MLELMEGIVKTKKVLVISLFVSIGIAGSQLDASEKQVMAEKLSPGERVTIDGVPNEPVWQRAPKGAGFIQRNPNEGKPGTEKTLFQVAYDNKNIYFFVYAYDSEPNKIKAILSRRDTYTSSDWISVSIDSYNDNRTAFEFWVNPAGVKRDLIRFDDENRDANWDPIWYCATRIDGAGWYAEFKIPFKELRFPEESVQEWGLQVYRHIARKHEDQYWTYWSKNEVGWVSHYGTLIGLQNIPRQKRVYIFPYTLGGAKVSRELSTSIHPEKYDLLSNIGCDIKVGLTNNMTMDMTINPDFGQVEADPGVLNLSAYETFYPEKRPFFVEGNNIFGFKLGIGDGFLSGNSLFYSRRIGRAPQRDVSDDYSSDTCLINQPEWTTILFAGKISGKTKRGLSLGILEAVTSNEYAKITLASGQSRKEIIEPLTSYSVARVQKDYRNGNTTLGGIITYTHRYINSDKLDFLRDKALTGGIDFTSLFWNRKYMIDFALAYSYVHGSKYAIRLTQESSARYFQRPDADYVSLDTNRTFLNGYAGKLAFGKIAGGHIRAAIGGVTASPGFEVNDLGYMREVDNIIWFTWLAYVETTPSHFYRNFQINFNFWSAYNFGKEKTTDGGNINGHIVFNNYWGFYMGSELQLPGISTSALRGGPALWREKSMNIWMGMVTDSRKDIYGDISIKYYTGEDGSNSFGTQLGITARPTQNFKLSLSPRYSSSLDTWAWVTHIEENGNDHYILAELKYKVAALQMRFDFTITPNLSIQFYCEPFLASGKYTKFKEVSNPRARNFNDRFTLFSDKQISYDAGENLYNIDYNVNGDVDFSFDNPNFNMRQYRANFVVRWEYLPGSILYLVWTQNINSYSDNGYFELYREMKNLFRESPHNVFMIKLSYLLNI